jgi:serine/threonine-protein kinase RsbW
MTARRSFSSSIYKVYGYTYPYEIGYYPEKIITLNASGQIYSAVALKQKDAVFHTNFLNLADPLTPRFAEQFEELGFFFVGVLPAGLPDGDALVLQYLNNVPIDYARIQLASDLAREILGYIRNHDPNR